LEEEAVAHDVPSAACFHSLEIASNQPPQWQQAWLCEGTWQQLRKMMWLVVCSRRQTTN
jgi:hypothetical protein